MLGLRNKWTIRSVVGTLRSCGISISNEAYCWGQNVQGQIGDGTKGAGNTRTTPVLVSGNIMFKELSSMGDHTCGISTSSDAYCWGANNFGQLGNGGLGMTTVNNGNMYGSDGSGLVSMTPTLVLGGHKFKKISTSASHTCGITTSNDIYCWGQNVYGQIGDGAGGTNMYNSSPTAIISYGSKFIDIKLISSATLAITEDFRLHFFGYSSPSSYVTMNASTSNYNGHLTALFPLEMYSKFLGGSATVFLFDMSRNHVYSWGANTFGQIGVGNNTNQLDYKFEVPYQNGSKYHTIQNVNQHSCGVNFENKIYCWGRNNSGQIGNGVANTTIVLTPYLVELP